MKAGAGKRKGGSFEREICKKLSLWISGGKNDSIFWRSAMSGGRATLQFKKGINNKSQICDISAIDPLGEKLLNKTIIECKSYRCLHVDSFIFNYSLKTDNIYNFWSKLLKIAYKVNKIPILICKQNKNKSLIILPYCVTIPLLLQPLAIIKNHGIHIAIFLLDDFLSVDFTKFENILIIEN